MPVLGTLKDYGLPLLLFRKIEDASFRYIEGLPDYLYYFFRKSGQALWSLMEPHEALWSPMKPYEALWSRRRPYEALWSLMKCYGAICSFMEPYEAL